MKKSRFLPIFCLLFLGSFVPCVDAMETETPYNSADTVIEDLIGSEEFPVCFLEDSFILDPSILSDHEEEAEEMVVSTSPYADYDNVTMGWMNESRKHENDMLFDGKKITFEKMAKESDQMKMFFDVNDCTRQEMTIEETFYNSRHDKEEGTIQLCCVAQIVAAEKAKRKRKQKKESPLEKEESTPREETPKFTLPAGLEELANKYKRKLENKKPKLHPFKKVLQTRVKEQLARQLIKVLKVAKINDKTLLPILTTILEYKSLFTEENKLEALLLKCLEIITNFNEETDVSTTKEHLRWLLIEL